MDYLYIQMVLFIEEISKTQVLMELELLYIETSRWFIMVNGLMTSLMVKVNNNLKMAVIILEILIMELNKDKEYLNGQMEANTQVCFLMV
jgi:hypothetical protein